MLRCRFGLLTLVFAMVVCLVAEPADAAAPKKPKRPKAPPKVAQNQFRIPATALNGNVNPAGTTPTTTDGTGGTTGKTNTAKGTDTKTVDKEADYDIADDAKVQKLHKFDTGLNFVEAKIDELTEGQKVTLSLVGKGDKKDVTHVSGTVAKIADGGKKVTLAMTVREKDDVPSGDGKQATLVSIRSVDKDKEK